MLMCDIVMVITYMSPFIFGILLNMYFHGVLDNTSLEVEEHHSIRSCDDNT